MVSVRKRGKVYEYRFEIATVEGTRKWITKSGYPTKAEAFKEGAKAYNDFYYNGQKTQLRENMSYADFLDYWIDNYASFNLHYSTTISYINIIKNHVKPRVGFYKLWQLDTRLLQEFINKIYVEYGFSKNYMASILKVVKGSLKYACYTLNYINTNPAEHVHAPRIDKIEKNPAHIFTQEENRKFYGDSYLYYYEKKVINEITKREQTKLIEANAELELPLPEAQLVFVKDNGQFLGTDSPKYAFKVIHYELGINSRFHDFRDTHATKLIESGADIKAVSKRLGHSTIQTTYNIYVRVTNKMESDTVDRFEKYTTTLDIPQTAEIPYQV